MPHVIILARNQPGDFMNRLILILTLLNVTACSSIQYKYEWAIDPQDKAQMERYYADQKECNDFAFKARTMGSRFFETDIMMGCMQRRGYKTNKVALK